MYIGHAENKIAFKKIAQAFIERDGKKGKGVWSASVKCKK